MEAMGVNMQSAVEEIRQSLEGNYLLPFFWQHGAEEQVLRTLMEKIRETGIREVCLESRPHPDFCGPKWWRDLDIIMDEAQKRDMRVWVLDDRQFPTGYAGGLIADKYPQHRRRFLNYVAIDALGPDARASFLIDSLCRHPQTDRLEAVVAARRLDSGAEWENARTDLDDLIDLTDHVQDGRLYWPVPEGLYSVIVVYSYLDEGTPLLNPISRDAVACQIEGCYQPHYEHYGHLFGSVFAGFFSDEPQFANGGWSSLPGKDIPLPWSDELQAALRAGMGADYRRLLPVLWLGGSDRTQAMRYLYMDQVSRLYAECFCQTLADWCHGHGVEYIGHQVEDNNSHSRLGPGTGHFFRSQKGRDMAGVDIVMHQIHPGYAGISRHWHSAHSLTDGEFFHYGLAKLASSMAHMDPLKKGRALCENFGAYGWMEGIRLMKWLADHCLVRGINRFTPHAFTDSPFPDWDSPPHFYAQGNNPQYRFMGHFFHYLNRMCHLLSGGVHISNVLVLYQADAEWWGSAMLSQKPLRCLMQRQIDPDIVPCDAFLKGAHAKDGHIRLGQERYGALIVPRAEALPGYFLSRLADMERFGVPVFFIDGKPLQTTAGERIPEPPGEVVSLEELAERVIASGLADAQVAPFCPNLRIYHYCKGTEHYYLLFNEERRDTLHFTLELPTDGPVLRFDVMNNRLFRQSACGRQMPLALEAYESMLLVTGMDGAVLEEPFHAGIGLTLDLRWRIMLADARRYPVFTPYQENVPLMDINGPGALPSFSGTIRYETDFEAGRGGRAQIRLHQIYETAELWLNGAYAGFCLSAPYRFDVSKWLRPGMNHLVIEVTNTLAKQVADYSSAIVPQEPGGMLAAPELVYEEESLYE